MDKFIKRLKTMQRRTLVLILVIALAVGAVGYAAAKYVSDYRKEAEIHAANFHFSSDYLAYNASPDYNVSDWGDHNVTFLLYNYDQENIAQLSETDIRYEIDVDSTWTVTVADAAGNTLSPTGGAYTLEASTAPTYHAVTLTYTGTGEPTQVEVEVESTSPYRKALGATFQLTTRRGIEYDVEDFTDYVVITLRTNNYYGDIQVKWNPNEYSPDNTCDYMGAWRDGIPGILDNAAEYTTYTMIFVKNETRDYSPGDFTITTETGA